jgi:hypothetical protein
MTQPTLAQDVMTFAYEGKKNKVRNWEISLSKAHVCFFQSFYVLLVPAIV